MKIFFLISICVVFGSSIELRPNPHRAAARLASQTVSITFVGTVKSIEPLGRRELKVIPVDCDSRFAVTVDVEEVAPKDAPLQSNKNQVFAIHSPARLFLAPEKEIIGSKYRFRVTWTDGSFSNLTAVRHEQRDTP
jgi:hypothetical protein